MHPSGEAEITVLIWIPDVVEYGIHSPQSEYTNEVQVGAGVGVGPGVGVITGVGVTVGVSTGVGVISGVGDGDGDGLGEGDGDASAYIYMAGFGSLRSVHITALFETAGEYWSLRSPVSWVACEVARSYM